ncbi:MAG: PAS domain-containing protein [Longimonas sp.]|uniref:sensor histidine kinase n=1 Tax=Longimonas sp. TaxID=2039626 RepID=UPI003347E949
MDREGVEVRQLVNRLPGAVYRCTYDTKWDSLYMGSGFKDICGIHPRTLDPSGRSFKEVVVEEDLDRIRKAVRTAVDEDAYYRVEYRIRSDEGEVRWVQDNGRPCLADDGSVKWLDGILLDITKRKHAEHGLLRAEEQVEAQVEARTEKLRELSAALTMAEQRERSQIASTVHDDLLQYLYGIQVQLQMLVNGIESTDALDVTALPVSPAQVDELMNEAIASARRLTLDLAPPVLEGDGIMEALQWLRTHFQTQHGFAISLQDESEGTACSGEVRTVLFRAVRELLANACEYADTHEASVRTYTNDDNFCIDVIDEGKGFDWEGVMKGKKKRGGIWEVQERLRSVDGKLHLDTAPGEGTHCKICVPVSAMNG